MFKPWLLKLIALLLIVVPDLGFAKVPATPLAEETIEADPVHSGRRGSASSLFFAGNTARRLKEPGSAWLLLFLTGTVGQKTTSPQTHFRTETA
jgi:hypothetical protein